ncbi:MAG: hypothetical protein ACOCSF_03265 [Halanaeroarchaeum sp.]
MSNTSNKSKEGKRTYRQRTVVGGLATGASFGVLGSEASGDVRAQTDDEPGEWPPADSWEAYVATLSGYQADVDTDAGAVRT